MKMKRKVIDVVFDALAIMLVVGLVTIIVAGYNKYQAQCEAYEAEIEMLEQKIDEQADESGAREDELENAIYSIMNDESYNITIHHDGACYIYEYDESENDLFGLVRNYKTSIGY